MEVHVPHEVILKPKRKRSTMEVHVPHDVILNHILPRVPAKSVGRFRCVSKEWHSFLMSKMFENMHIDHQKNNIKLLVISKSERALFEFMFTTIDCEAPPSHDKGLTPTNRPLPQFEEANPHRIHILTSFHGLVCLGILEIKNVHVYSHLILWNPLTNEYKRLSKFNSHKKYNNDIWHSDSDFGLYYSSCEDDYKLLLVKYYNHVYNYENKKSVYIYSLKLDSWRKVDDFQHTGKLYPGYWSRGTYLNENLYFLQEHSRPNGRLSSIMRFNTKTERLSLIETPSVDDYPKACNYFATIMVKSDCIHVCIKYDIVKMSYDEYGNMEDFGKTCIKLWKLDENGNMKEVVSYQLLKRPNVYDDTIIIHLIPFHLMKNGNWLMRNRCYKHSIYEVDLKKKKHIKDKGKGNISDDFEYAEVRVDDKNNDIVDVDGRYIETFVSPNRYMK